MTEKIRILIVDDEVKFLDSIARRLEMRDFDVSKASNGEDALKLVRQKTFDLALLDLKMPGIDGQQVLRKLKSDHPYIEVIILTGHGSIDSAVECTKLGAIGYLPKPYELDPLIQKLKEAYKERVTKIFEKDVDRMERIQQICMGNSPLGILRALHDLENEGK
ncbi:MAG: response regulator [Candidatus Omnitrophica bacterium]|nr:response regulator [Candidatus Omnitrophota bacterium]